jgi:F-type H+-transporting ATPase subunit delta
MIPAAISLRYARALVELAEKVDRLEAVASGLEQLSAICDEHEELQAVMNHPGFSVGQRTAVFNELMKRLNLDDLLRPFMGLVIEKGRLPALRGISASVQSLTDQSLGRVRARAISAHELTDAQRHAVAQALQAKVGQTIVLEATVDPSLIAGLQVQIGSELYDGSVKGRLDRLGRQLLAN